VEELLEPEIATPSGASLLISPFARLFKQNLSRNFWVFFTVAFFFDFGFAVYFFLFNLYLLDLHFNERTIGLVGGALAFGSVIGTLPAGWLARKTGLRPLMAICLIAAPALGVVRALVTGEWAQIASAFLAGLAMCIWGVTFLPAVASLTTEENRASAFSLIFSVGIGASAFGSVVCGYLPQWLMAAGFTLQGVDVKRTILITSCCIALLGILPLLSLRLPPPVLEPQARDKTSRKPWRINAFLLVFLPCMAIWTAAQASFTPFASVYLARGLEIQMPQIGLILSASQLVQLGAGLLTQLVFRRLGLVNGIVATQIATAATLACLTGASNKGMAVLVFLSFFAAQWMSSPGIYNLLMSKIPEQERSSASAMTLFSNAVLGSFATAGAGMLFAQFGYPRVLAGISTLALIAALLFKFLVTPAVRTQGNPLEPTPLRFPHS